MESAHVVIVNHALYMTDVALRRLGASFLPEHDVAIFDEAHTLEAVASEHLGTKVGQGQVEYFLRKLDDERTDRGLIARCREALGDEWFKAADAQAGRAWAASYDFFAAVAALMSGDPGRGIGPKTTLRFHEPPGWPAPLAEELRKLATVLGRGVATLEVRAGVRTLSNGKKLATPDEPPGVRDLRLDLDADRSRAAALASGIESWINQDVLGGVYWVEFDQAKRRVTLASAPLEVGPTLRAEVFDRVPTCILTSATLAVGAPPRFDHVTGRLGLDTARALAVGSPFDYAKHVKLHLSRGLPCPSKKSADYERAAIRAIPYYVERTNGKAFVLFTANRMMEDAARELRPWFDRRRIALITQGDGMPRTKMIETFKAIHEGGGAATLFGVDSFWEGVDVPGEALSNVIIPRLPFRVPDHPLWQARHEMIERRGGNPFMERTVPDAVIKLRQGFGRLMRRCTDSGIVVILDPRLLSKPYGRTFLDSLPACRRVVEDLRAVVAVPAAGAGS
ncbi:MAG: hypothetical protein JO116_18905 [Planctomycetaceae bacterium]|nr:hypothetical protein [Planctomycetaceae bacterium]